MSVSDRVAGILGWFKGLLSWGGEDELIDKIQSVIVRIREHKDSIDEFAFRMQKRAEELSQKVSEYMKRSQLTSLTEDERLVNYNLARTFAEEMVEIKRFTKAVRFVSIGLEKVAQRLQTVKDIKDLQAQLGPIKLLLQGLKQEVENVFPSVGAAIDDINRSIAELMINTSSGMHEVNQLDTYTKDSEVEKVIKEAWELATASVEKVIPEPIALTQARQPDQKIERKSPSPIDVTVNRGKQAEIAGAVASSASRVKLEELERLVLEEIKANKGKISVDEFAQRHRVSKNDVFNALESLSKKGKIRVMGATSSQ